ncbi:MAG: RNA-binding S4 domain-containing protein [Pseudomonadota bacterium]
MAKKAKTKPDKSAKPANEHEPGQRLDKWLWYARIFKTRGLAQRMVTDGRVRIDSVRAEAAHKTVRPGNVLTVTLDRDIKVLEILAPGERRGPAPEAQALYKDLSPPKPKVPYEPDPRRMAAPKPEKRPDRKDRAALGAMKRSHLEE